MASKKNRSRKSLAVALAIVGVAGLSMASAAQLSVNSDQVVAGVNQFVACDSDVGVHYTHAYDSVTSKYKVTAVVVDGLAAGACTGKTVTVKVLKADKTVYGTYTSAAILAADTSVTILVTSGLPATLSVEDVYGAAVEIG